MNKCDVLIVGAGVSGLYAAYRLGHKYPNAEIIVTEKLKRVGGRIITTKYGEHILEYGPMRFEPALQPCFAGMVKELGLQTKDFPPYNSPFEAPDFNKLTFDEVAAIHRYVTLPPAFALLKLGLSRILEDQWDVDQDYIHDRSRDDRKQWLKTEGMFQSRYLWQYGLWDILVHVLSKSAIDFIQQKGTFYHMLHLNPNAADQICFMLDIIATSQDKLITIDGGSYKVIEALKRKVENLSNVKILTKTLVSKYTDCDDYTINVSTLGLMGSQTITCKHLIFTCQQKAYNNNYNSISGLPSYITELITKSVMVVKLFKVFAVFTNPPFDETSVPLPNYRADQVPCREIHYGYDDKNKTGMMMIYGDVPSLNYWRDFHTSYGAMPEWDGGENMQLKNHLVHYLRKIFPEARTSSLLYYTIMDWSHAPYMSGVHLWRPKVQSSEVITKLSAFGKNNNVHVGGEAFSSYQGFIEGGLRSMDLIMQRLSHKYEISV